MNDSLYLPKSTTTHRRATNTTVPMNVVNRPRFLLLISRLTCASSPVSHPDFAVASNPCTNRGLRQPVSTIFTTPPRFSARRVQATKGFEQRNVHRAFCACFGARSPLLGSASVRVVGAQVSFSGGASGRVGTHVVTLHILSLFLTCHSNLARDVWARGVSAVPNFDHCLQSSDDTLQSTLLFGPTFQSINRMAFPSNAIL